MKKFNFPFAYEPKVNLKNTIIYSDIFRQQVFKYLQNKYKCICLDPAFVVDNKRSALAYVNGDRVMSFDNKENNSIFSINSIQDNYLLLASNIFQTDNIVTFAPNIKRDAKQTNLDSIMNWDIDAELSIPIGMTMKYFTDLAKEIFYAIVNIAYLPELSKIHKVAKKKVNPKDIVVVDAQRIETAYPTLSLQQGFKHYCSEHRFVIVQNNLKKLKSGRTFEPTIPTAQDNDLSCGLYVYDEINNQPLLLINLCKRPNGSTSKIQLNESNPLELANDLYDHGVFDKNRPTNISLVIKYTNILYYFLDKIHLAEVVKSVWPDEFIDFVKAEKIEIF